jgi:hypothetical protein
MAWMAPAQAALSAPAGNALDWVAKELDANGHAIPSSFGGNDWGLTIDSVLALVAGGRGSSAAAVDATSNVMSHAANEYFTGASFDSPNDRYAGAMAKTLLLAKARGVATNNIGGFDVEATLRGLMQTTGAQAGRFSDKSDFGDFSNGFGAAFAIASLARTSAGVPSTAIAFFLKQQCPAGGFRLSYAATATDPAGCTADTAADTDATSMAIQALGAAPRVPNTNAAITRAATWLKGRQDANGGVSGTGPTASANANSAGLAAGAFRIAGDSAAVAAAQTFVASLQLTQTADAGAIAADAAARDAANSGGIDAAKRDQFRRATAQGALALGLDGYDTMGGHSPVTLVAQATPTATNVAPGDTIAVTGGGFLTDEPVTAVLNSDPINLGTKPAVGGTVTFATTLATNFATGQHQFTLTGAVSGSVASAIFQVVTPTAPTTAITAGSTTTPTVFAAATTTTARGATSPLSVTGTDLRRPIVMALALLAMGGVLVTAAGWRRRHT